MRFNILAVTRHDPEWLIGILLLLPIVESGEHGLGDGSQLAKDANQVAEVGNVDELKHPTRDQFQHVFVGKLAALFHSAVHHYPEPGVGRTEFLVFDRLLPQSVREDPFKALRSLRRFGPGLPTAVAVDTITHRSSSLYPTSYPRLPRKPWTR